MPRRRPPPATEFEKALGAAPPPDEPPEPEQGMPKPLQAETFATELTEKMIRIVDQALRAGQPANMLAGLVAVRDGTFKRWVAEGLDEGCTDPLKVRLAFVVARGRALQGQHTVELLKVHGLQDPKALMNLARTQNQEWSEKTTTKIEMDATISRPAEDLSVLSDEELAMRAAIEEKIAAARLGKGS